MSDHAASDSAPKAPQSAGPNAPPDASPNAPPGASPRGAPLTRTPQRGRVAPGSVEEKRLREIWEAPPGWRGWLSTVDHKTIGLRYLVTAFVFLLMGGVEALIMRIQLARPNATVLTPSSTTNSSRCTA